MFCFSCMNHNLKTDVVINENTKIESENCEVENCIFEESKCEETGCEETGCEEIGCDDDIESETEYNQNDPILSLKTTYEKTNVLVVLFIAAVGYSLLLKIIYNSI